MGRDARAEAWDGKRAAYPDGTRVRDDGRYGTVTGITADAGVVVAFDDGRTFAVAEPEIVATAVAVAEFDADADPDDLYGSVAPSVPDAAWDAEVRSAVAAVRHVVVDHGVPVATFAADLPADSGLPDDDARYAIAYDARSFRGCDGAEIAAHPPGRRDATDVAVTLVDRFRRSGTAAYATASAPDAYDDGDGAAFVITYDDGTTWNVEVTPVGDDGPKRHADGSLCFAPDPEPVAGRDRVRPNDRPARMSAATFRLLADAIRGASPEVVDRVADVLYRSSDAFDRGRFRRAAGVD